jgi:hypothetical protein
LPRDSYVNIPGYGMNKLNAAYELGISSTPSGDAWTAKQAAAGAERCSSRPSLTLTGLNDRSLRVRWGMIGFYRHQQTRSTVCRVNLCQSRRRHGGAQPARSAQGGGSGLKMSAGRHTIHGCALRWSSCVSGTGCPTATSTAPRGSATFIIQPRSARSPRPEYCSTPASCTRTRSPRSTSALDVDSGLDLTTLALQMSALDPANITSKAIPFVRLDTVDVGSVEIVDPAQVHAFVANLIHPVAPTPKPSPMARPRPSHSAVARKPVSSGCIN